MEQNTIYVTKRGNRGIEELNLNKITNRIKYLCNGLNVNYNKIALKTIAEIYNKIPTEELDVISSNIAEDWKVENLDYSILASRIFVSNMHKGTPKRFSESCVLIHKEFPRQFDKKYFIFVEENKDILDNMIVDNNDYNFTLFGLKTLTNASRYVMERIDRPQYLWMRVAICIHYDNTGKIEKNEQLDNIKRTYKMLSQRKYIHGSPTLFNSCTENPQLLSCFLLGVDDNIESIMKLNYNISIISKWAGGIGISYSSIRARNSKIRGTKGISDGIIPQLSITNQCAKTWNQGGNKRPGAFSVYLQPDHADFMEFLGLRIAGGSHDYPTKDLFPALWIPDLFVKRLIKYILYIQKREKEANGITNESKLKEIYDKYPLPKWSVFSPSEVPRKLDDVIGEEYEKLYTEYEENKLYKKQYDFGEIIEALCRSLRETGTPYILFKDHSNHKSNQKNLGVIKNSNLCVTGDTKILTSNGYQIIKDLIDQYVEVWNGEEFSKSLVKQTGTNQKIIKITFSNGSVLECTEYHKFYIQNEKNNSNSLEYIVKAKDLKIGMILANCKYPETKIKEFNHQHNVKVTKIKDEDKKADTYCFGEPKRNAGIFNGVFTSQCAEILEWSSSDSYACCTLASIRLPEFVRINELRQLYAKTTNNIGQYGNINDPETKKNILKYFNWQDLYETAYNVQINLDRIIDVNKYPVPETEKNNKMYRPTAIGSQGLADVFLMYRVSFTSPVAKLLNKYIYETIYYGAMRASCDLAKKYGPYEGYEGSPMSQGKFQFDLWAEFATSKSPKVDKSEFMWSWPELAIDIGKYGVRNSLTTAEMPTASTSQILGSNECIEPYTRNIYGRHTLSGNFTILNEEMVRHFIELGLWSTSMKHRIQENQGSVQNIKEIPQNVKELYLTANEIDQKEILNMSADRGLFVDQTQSLNLYGKNMTNNEYIMNIIHGWKLGLKTGSYYTHSTKVEGSTISAPNQVKEITKEEVKACPLNPKDRENCDSCGA